MRLLRARRSSAPIPPSVDRRGPSAGAARTDPGRTGGRPGLACAVSSGCSVEDLEARREQLAASIGLRELRVLRDPGDASRGTVTFVRRDPLAAGTVPWPHGRRRALSLWEPVPVGVDELGDTVRIALVERNVLLGGEPGAGKSAALSLLVATAALDPSCRLWLLDGKLVELSAWAPCAERLAGPDVDEAIALLRAVRSEMEERYRELLARGTRKISRGRRTAAAPGGVRRARVLPGRRGPQAADRVRRAAARPGRPRPRGRRHRVRGDAEARVRRRPVGAQGSVRVPARACAATRRRRRTRSSARAGRAPATAPPRSRPASAASATCSPRTACPSACAASTCPTSRSRAIAERASALRADAWLAAEARRRAVTARERAKANALGAARERALDPPDRRPARRSARHRGGLAARPRRVVRGPRVRAVRRALHPCQRTAAVLHPPARRQAPARVRAAARDRRLPPARPRARGPARRVRRA